MNWASSAGRQAKGKMEISEAKAFKDNTVDLVWTDRRGVQQSKCVHVFEVGFIPLYGPCLITTEGDIRLDRVVACNYRLAQAG